MIAELFTDYFLVATLLLGIAVAALSRLRDPAKRVLVVRAVFVATLCLPMLLLLPGLPRFAWRKLQPSPERPQSTAFSPPVANTVADPAWHENFAPHDAPPQDGLPDDERMRRMMFAASTGNAPEQNSANEIAAMPGDSTAAENVVATSPVTQAPVAETSKNSVSNTNQMPAIDAATIPAHREQITATSITASTTVSATAAIPATSKGPLLLKAFLLLQCAAVIATACWQGLGFLFASRFLREATPVSLGSVELQTFGGKGRRCRVMTHAKLTSPAILGVFRPTILLPDVPDEREKRLALAYERAHFENGDLSALAIERLLMFLLCLHPMFWWLRARMHGDQEILADLKAAELSDRTLYAEQLLAWAKRAMRQPAFAGASMLGIVEFSGKKTPQRKTLLTRRITMLLDENVRLTKISKATKLTTLTVAAVLTVLFSMQTLRPQ